MKLKLLKNIFLVLMIILFTGPIMAYDGTIDEGLKVYHISIMFTLMMLLMVVIYMSFKCWDIFRERGFSFSFRFITAGLIILGVNQALVISSHFGVITFTKLFEHLVDIVGYFVLGLGLYFIIKNRNIKPSKIVQI